MATDKKDRVIHERKEPEKIQEHMPSAKGDAQKLGRTTSTDNFCGKDGIFIKLFSKTI